MREVWWEDRFQDGMSKLFGPHQLLAGILADELGGSTYVEARRFRSVPRKGVGNMIRELDPATGPPTGVPVCAVLDRDRVRDHLGGAGNVERCNSGITTALRHRAPGVYKIVLVHNTEALVEAACDALGIPCPEKSPFERDRILGKLGNWPQRGPRDVVRAKVDGLERLVQWMLAPT